MSDLFISQLDGLDRWRLEVVERLGQFTDWLRQHDLLDEVFEERLQALAWQVRSDKIMLAFVAEFSRGKSELINALFFAHYGQRIMPASAGRTTMCPTEIGYDPQLPPCLRLLPIDSRGQPLSLMAWRACPEAWTQMALDVQDPQQMAHTLQQVVQTMPVSVQQAEALGLWSAQAPEDNPPLDAQGRLEVPRWRHAMINLPHPLLAQGLVVLDTPGLNALGAEPELTVSLLPLAQATIFILGADTGVTRSDDTIWREHLLDRAVAQDIRWVVLNKIDTLWDALSSPEAIQAQIERQRIQVAQQLAVAVDQVFAISAHKGLLAKIANDASLLQASGLPALEQALAWQLTQQRQRIVQATVARGLSELRGEAQRVLHVRRRDLLEQLLELKNLRGKNGAIIRHLRACIAQEQVDFHRSGARVQAVEAVHQKQVRALLGLLGASDLRDEMQTLARSLQANALKLGAKRSYGATFGRLRQQLAQVSQQLAELHALLVSALDQLNAEFGFSLHAPSLPNSHVWCRDLDLIERNHVQYLGLTNAIRLARPDFSERLVRALHTRIRNVQQGVMSELELWSKSMTSQLDAQLRERQQHFSRRIEAIDRIQQAAEGLDQRIAQIQVQVQACDQLDSRLQQMAAELQEGPQRSAVAAMPSALEVA